MQTTIDRAGRVVVPKAVRLAAGLRAGMTLDVRVRDGVIEIEPAARPVRLVEKGPLLVAEPLEEVEPVTNEEVERVLTELRERRVGYE
ncbi:MAG: AbrB/MazE/SpoVT family DNA-binding domain-containing protein [Chloroflexi bacterium]|nr:AbrB/MazE/SpoVT family DNA-binding domain-containing protein [Chloroflexota bacterium]